LARRSIQIRARRPDVRIVRENLPQAIIERHGLGLNECARQDPEGAAKGEAFHL
jgi:hypothetical protein